MEVSGRAPLRIYFAGDGTDLEEVYTKFGGKILNATIDKYTHGVIRKRKDKKKFINGVQLRCSDEFTKRVIRKINPSFGFDFWYSNDLPPGRGLGSSSTYAVLLLRLISELQGDVLDDDQIVKMVYGVENEVGKCGWQDMYASAMGGFNFIELNGDNKIYPLRIKYATIRNLEEHLILVYTKLDHNSHAIQEETVKLLTKNKVDALKILSEKIKHALMNNDIRDIGLHLSHSWYISKSSATCNQEIEDLHKLGINCGAWGGKLLGAGLGGYMLFYVDPKKRQSFKEQITKYGYEYEDFHFTNSGVETW